MRHFLAIPDFSTPELEKLSRAGRVHARGDVHGAPAPGPVAGDDLHEVIDQDARLIRGRRATSSAATRCSSRRATCSSDAVSRSRTPPESSRVTWTGIMIRTFAHRDVEEMAAHATVPVINGLTDLLHPCQILADLLTVRQHLGGHRGQVRRVGRRRQQHGELVDQCRLSIRLRPAARVPRGLRPRSDTAPARARTRGTSRSCAIRVRRSPGADVVNTDVWASMGQEEEQRNGAGVREVQGR